MWLLAYSLCRVLPFLRSGFDQHSRADIASVGPESPDKACRCGGRLVTRVVGLVGEMAQDCGVRGL